jgi:hypothetical protein
MFAVYATHADPENPLAALKIGEQPGKKRGRSLIDTPLSIWLRPLFFRRDSIRVFVIRFPKKSAARCTLTG